MGLSNLDGGGHASLEEILHATDTAFCMICGTKIVDSNIQLCDSEECIDYFSDTYLQGLYHVLEP